MALGGGSWTAHSKVLPGAYINFVSAAMAAAALSERGVAAVPLLLEWGPDDEIFTVTGEEVRANSLQLFGHAYADKEMLPLRELFRHARTLLAYRLNSGGAKAENALCAAKYAGIAGNRLSVTVEVNVDNSTLFDVITRIDTTVVDTQTVATADKLVPNDFVTWKSDAVLEETAKMPLTGGTNGTASAAAYQSFLDKLESYSFNVLGCPSEDPTTIGLFINYTKRLRDELGAKFQTVIYNPSDAAKIGDYEGVIEVGNKVSGYDSTVAGLGAYALVYWLTGFEAALEVNKSGSNKPYDGELAADVNYTQAELAAAIKQGRFLLHNVGGEVRVLCDVNSLTTVTDNKGEDFKSNQTIRVIDRLANDMALLFSTRYLGEMPNDADGRVTLWNDVVKLHQALEKLRAIEDFNPDTVTIERGETKKAVVCNISELNIVNAMEQLYVSVVIV